MNEPAIRIGILGCASVSEYAMLAPAANNPSIVVAAVASRTAARASAYAGQHGISRSYGSYEALLDAGDLDAVYIPLPTSMHDFWSIQALQRGLPVLCEKPFAGNAARAQAMADVASQTGMPLLEAVHWRYHPLAQRLKQLIGDGAIGRVSSIRVWFKSPASSLEPDNFRLHYHSGGGCMLDMGCYCVSLARMVAGAEPEAVLYASAMLYSPLVDNGMETALQFPGGVTARLSLSMREAGGGLELGARIIGETGEIKVANPFLPCLGSSLSIKDAQGERTEQFTLRSSYAFQADVLVSVLRQLPAAIVTNTDSIANMVVLDSVYRKAGLPERGLDRDAPVVGPS